MAVIREELESDFEAAYRANYLAVARRSRRLMPAADAEDAVQETFLRAWAHHGPRNPGLPWLFTVLRNLSIDRARTDHSEPVGDTEVLDSPTGDTTAESVLSLEERDILADVLARLTDSQREAIRLRAVEGRSYEEIADAMKLSVAAVQSLLLRGRGRLRRLLPETMSDWTKVTASVITAALIAAGAFLGFRGSGSSSIVQAEGPAIENAIDAPTLPRLVPSDLGRREVSRNAGETATTVITPPAIGNDRPIENPGGSGGQATPPPTEEIDALAKDVQKQLPPLPPPPEVPDP
ncbi:MAG: RNA polymerase sigma factor [Actinomycetota bacterium]